MQALSDFALIARHGGFGAASRATGRSKATLARRLADLEQKLAVRLFERGHSGVKLTDAGAELLLRINRPFNEIRNAAEAVSHTGNGLNGALRISAAVVFAHAHLTRVAAKFSRLHPGVEIELVADDEMADLIEERFDIVIRANPNPVDQLVGKCIVRTERVAVAAPDLAMPAESGRASLIFRCTEKPRLSWKLLTETGYRVLELRPAIGLSTLMMIREAALHGAGVALLPRTLIEEDLAAGRLSCWGIDAEGQTEIWALHASSRLPSRKVVAFLEYLEVEMHSSSGDLRTQLPCGA